MAAVPIYVWNGTAWQETGPTIPASPIKYQASAPSSPSTGDIWVDSDGDVTTGSQQFQRFRFVASGGETSESGADANGAVLAYTPGAELVVLNGSTLVRGQDYTATNGTSITGLSPALVANDVLEVFSFIAFSVANTYTQSQVDGLVNNARAASGLVLITTQTFSGSTSVSFPTDTFTTTYDNYRILFNISASSGAANINFRMRLSGTGDATTNAYSYSGYQATAGSLANDSATSQTSAKLCEANNSYQNFVYTSWDLFTPKLAVPTKYTVSTFGGSTGGAYEGYNLSGIHDVSIAYDSLSVIPSTGTITGSYSVYGYNK